VELKKAEASDKEEDDNFGFSVALSGGTAIVGAFGEDDPGSSSGAAYIFSRNAGGAENWGEVAKLEASDKEADDVFGRSVALSGDTAIVGAPFEDDPGSDSGAAYFFKVNCPPQVSPQTVVVDQGGSVDDGTLATTIDDLTASDDLLVDLPGPLPPGIDITDLTNTDGTITADVDVDCDVAFGDYLVVIDVTDEHGETSSAMFTISVGGIDTDGDGSSDLCDADDDNDGVDDGDDTAPLDPTICEDIDGDSCDDCAVGVDGFGPLADNDQANDGPDADGDGLCDAGDGLLFSPSETQTLPSRQVFEEGVYGIAPPGTGSIEDFIATFIPFQLELDALDYDGGDYLYFSVKPGGFVAHPGGTIQLYEGNVYRVHMGTGVIEPALEWGAEGIDVETLDGVTRLSANKWAFSVDERKTVIDGAGRRKRLFPANVYQYNSNNGKIKLLFKLSEIGVSNADAVHVITSKRVGFSVDEVTYIPLRSGINRLYPSRVYIYDKSDGSLVESFSGSGYNIDG
ncbi:MAG: hypothetical protein GY755_13895, partial [Chloroflexi bacterium]|nr:hypothetical protein [Chloroflexota bacterium]